MAGTTTYFGISYPQSTDLVKDGAANMQTIATGFDSAVAIPTYNNQTGTTYTFALSDIGKTVTASNAGASTYTIPPTASVTWPSNTTLDVVNLGAGVVTFAAGAGVTVTNTAATLAQYQSAQLIRTGLNAWTVVPNGGGKGMTLLSTTTLSGSSTTISGIPQTYTDLYIYVFGMTNATSDAGTQIRPNAATNLVYGAGSSNGAGTLNLRGQIDAAIQGANALLRTDANNMYAARIGNYSNTTNYKSLHYSLAYLSSTSIYQAEQYAGAIKTNSAITSLVIIKDSSQVWSTGTVLIYGA
jgi:hypothetical protein